MEISETLKRQLIKKLLFARTRLLCSHPFFGLLLMHVKFLLDTETETAATDGESIYFGVDFLRELSDSELDFVLMHEILHIALRQCFRAEGKDEMAFNVACDIVVNSNILHETGNINSIYLGKYGECIHLAPNGKEGYNYTAEEVYAMLPHSAKFKNGGAHGNSCNLHGKNGNSHGKNGNGTFAETAKNGGTKGKGSGGSHGSRRKGVFDEHGKWHNDESNAHLSTVWAERVKNATEAVSIREKSLNRGLVPLAAKRAMAEFGKPQLDWRTILNNFIQEDIVDYSFLPPDKRYDGDFFLPDFNEKDEKIEDILFMIDTSGSMSDKMIKSAFSEIKGAIDQFGGKLRGLLGFFDATVVPPLPFSDEKELKIIRPYGGGGTSFGIIFEHVRARMTEKPPVSIIILTDGNALFPDEKVAQGIPVLWIINNEEITPPWGKIVRIKD